MTSKMKGIYRGFKFISRLFGGKEREMEIGYPTDVKHVAHIGLDGAHGDAPAPTWMNEFKTSSNFSLSSIADSSRDPTIGLESHSSGKQHKSDTFNSFSSTNLPSTPKKHRHNKAKSSSSLNKSSNLINILSDSI